MEKIFFYSNQYTISTFEICFEKPEFGQQMNEKAKKFLSNLCVHGFMFLLSHFWLTMRLLVYINTFSRTQALFFDMIGKLKKKKKDAQ